MKQLNSTVGVLGPFKTIDRLSDRYRCDNVDFQFDIIGAAVVEDYVAPVTPYDIDGARTHLIKQIDADVDAIYDAVVGNRSDEYNAALAAATSYAAAGYAGVVPSSVQSWASAKFWTAHQAADDILAAAAGLASLRENIRAQRLAKKESARNAADAAAVATVSAQWSAALAALRAAAGL